MALKEPERLQNLKICVDNVDSESDDDNLSLTEDPEISIEDETPNKVGNVSNTSEELADTDHVGEVQFNVYLNKIVEPKKIDSTFIRANKTYENKEGNFVTGIDFTNKDEIDKREERAKRFGLEFKPQPIVDLDGLYDSLGIKLEDLSGRDERGIRLEAIHLRGVDDMNTKDVFNYFQEFAAGGCEWIDDESCNVVWMDKMTAARAMLKLSRSYADVMAEYGLSVNKRRDDPKPTEKMKKDTNLAETDKPTDDSEQKEAGPETDRNEEKMEDDDELDLTEEKNEQMVEPEVKTDEPEKMEDEGIEEGEIMDSDSEEEADVSADSEAFNRIPWPPGRWRLGKSYHNKGQYMFFRFATKADIKLPGAERRSKYYQKYGNPNYGGMRGLISGTMKRKMRTYNKRDDSLEALETFGVGDDTIPKIGNRNQVSYEDDLFSDANTAEQVEEMELYSKTDRLGTSEQKDKKPHSEDEDDNLSHMSDENDFPTIEKINPDDEKEKGSDSDVDEAELERLLGKPNKRPAMRMYADDVEQEWQSVKTRQEVGALTIVADSKKKGRLKDARQLITGMRAALKEKTFNSNRRLSPGDGLSGSSSESRSPSPEYKEPSKIQRISPIHMTIENNPEDRSRSPSPEEVEEEEVVKKTPSPIAFKTKMDETNSPDLRSRLSNKNPGAGARNRMNRRSPNNVRSRLSARVPSENDSPPASPDRRVPRIRRQRSRSPIDFKSKFRRSRSPFSRRHRRLVSRSPERRRFNRRSRSPVYNRRLNRNNRSPPRRRFNRSRSRSPLRRPNIRSNFRSRSPMRRRFNDRTRPGRDARSRLGRKSRSPTDTDSDSEPETAPKARSKKTAAGESSDSSSSSSSSSDSDSSSSSNSSSSSSSSSSSESSSSDSDSDASERSAIRNKKSQRRPAQERKRYVPSPRPERGRQRTMRRDGRSKR